MPSVIFRHLDEGIDFSDVINLVLREEKYMTYIYSSVTCNRNNGATVYFRYKPSYKSGNFSEERFLQQLEVETKENLVRMAKIAATYGGKY